MAEEQVQGNESVAPENDADKEKETPKEAQAQPARSSSGDRPATSRPYTPRSSGGRPPRRQGGGGRRGGYDRRFGRRLKKACQFCKEGSKGIDYKRADGLRRFITERGNIRSRRKVGNCAKHQRQLAIAIKRARHMALLPYTAGHMRGQ